MNRHSLLTLVAVAAASLALAGCKNDARTGALIGGAAGAAGGYIIGNEMDKDDQHRAPQNPLRREEDRAR